MDGFRLPFNSDPAGLEQSVPVNLAAFGWKSVKDNPPDSEHELCAVYFPIGVNGLTGKTFGPVAVAYWAGGTFLMADIPSSLRGPLGELGPYYWREYDIYGKIVEK